MLLGSAAPAALLGDDPEILDGNVYGLMQACGTPSVEHDHMLKRSARHAMSLLKFLVCDFVEDGADPPTDGSPNLNLFAQAFCSLPVDKYSFLSLDLHLLGDQRGGAKEDACHVMVLVLSHHMGEDGETPVPLAKQDLLANPDSHQGFQLWCTQNTSKATQDLMKKNNKVRLQTLKAEQEMEANEFDDEESDSEGDYIGDEDGAMAELKKKRKAAKREIMEATQAGDLEQMTGPALRWEDSQLYREQRARLAAHQRMQKGGEYHDTVRDSQEAALEMKEREEEKAQILRKDPLGLKVNDDFDLRTVENNQVHLLEQALSEFQEELRKGEAGGEDDKALRAKKESLEMILDGIAGVTGAEGNIDETGRSILPTEPNFDPILFLTLVHRKATYEELVGSMNRLSSKYLRA